MVIDRENEVSNDSAIEPEDNTDVSKKSYLNEQNLSNKVNVEDGNLKQSGSSVIDSLVTESDRNSCKPFICEECKAEFKYKQSLAQHIRSKHEGVRYSCDNCDHKATEVGNLKKHKE